MSAQALLVMDFQPPNVAAVGGDDGPVLAAAVSAVDAARKAGVPIIHVRVAFRDGYREVNAANKNMSPLTGYGDVFIETSATSQIHPAITVAPEDSVVVKRRVSAFASDLAPLLSGLGVTKLVLAGIVTSGVVLSTVRHASDADFELTVLSDACGDPDPVVHQVLIEKIFPQQAEVVTVKEWADTL
ncbi:cysteine hydrolase [Pseudonocardia kujensis]|uniref:cysteine hydrolase family protein n=1 Tax=Pseudonocardia kujensis TaxID=1128675 RepID=UPI001E62BAFB|nr:isochorismatase family cysteine hydrolase [Pseudonocardia kujensis]MCE0767815.1 cysteine hydrolase [Pseudonocardia kujensis]